MFHHISSIQVLNGFLSRFTAWNSFSAGAQNPLILSEPEFNIASGHYTIHYARWPKVKSQKSNRFQGCNDLILRVYLGCTKILISKLEAHYKLQYFGCSIRWIGFLGSDFIKGPNRFIKVFIGFRYWRFKIYKFGIKGINKVSPIRGLQLICFQTEMKLANLRDTCIILYS